MLLFVYGTLKRGGKYHAYLEEAALVAEHAIANGFLYDTGLGYPSMVMTEEAEIHGEIYEIPDALWPAIDDLEGYTGGAETDLYDKQMINVKVEGQLQQTVVYVAKNPALLEERIETGIWDVDAV